MKVRRLFTLLVAVAIAIAIGFAWNPSPAQADDTVDVGVTRAMEQIINAFDTAAVDERFPNARGEVVSRWTNLAGGDTGWSAPEDRVTDTVDTGWDMSDIHDTTHFEGLAVTDVFGETESIAANDTRVRAVEIANLGNNYVEIDFSAYHLIGEGYQNEFTDGNDTFTLELHYADGSYTAEDFYTLPDEDLEGVGGSDGDVTGWTMGEVKTLFLVVKSGVDAADGDEIKSDFWVTNNAPVRDPSGSGDAWERGVPVGEDQYDTQTGLFWTVVEGPVIQIDKSHDTPSGRTRPGDTIDYTLTVDNIGSDTASGVTIIDAIPQHTTYIAGSAAGDDPDYGESVDIDFSDNLNADNFDDADDDATEMIRWYYDTIPADQEDGEYGSLELSFSVTID